MMTKPIARKRLWIRRGIPVVVVVLVVGGVYGTRAFASGGSSPSYRLGRVTTGSIDQTLTLSGTAEKVSQATSSFKVSGTVKTVPVGIGDSVTAGQTLATLDPTALQQAVTSAKATLAQAEATLDNDENGTSSNSSSASSSASSSSSPASSSSAAKGATPKERAAAAAGVKAAQQKVDADEQAAAAGVGTLLTDIAEQAKECAAFLPAATPATSPSATPAATPPTMDDCLTAVQATVTDQAKLASAQTALQNLPGDQKALAQALTNQAKVNAAGSSTGSGSGSGSGSSTGSSSGRTGTSGGSGSSSSSASSGSGSSDFTAQRVASDQVAVQSGTSALAAAQDNLAQGTLTAPISGTVAALSFVPGSSSSSASVTIIGAGAVDVTVNVPLASLPKVKVGQAATVVSNGSGTVMAGTVRSISLLPASSSTTSVSYPVVVRVPQPTAALASGSTATATITLATVKNVITVPNSALTTLVSGTGFVQTVKAGKVTRTLVRTGAVGATTTQIISGLTVGQQVVIANLSEALPTTTTTSRFGARTGTSGLTSSLSGAGGGLGGAPTFVGGGGGFRGPGG
jgi:multidrug efflux pump subunit AcrA (membrane-fusion protein)